MSLFVTAGCGTEAKLKNGEEIVGKLEGKTITADELYQSLKKENGTNAFVTLVDTYIANKEIADSDAITNEAKSQLEQLKAQYESAGQDFATALSNAGYKKEKDFLDVLILDIKKNKVVENFLKEKVTDDEIQDYYEKNIAGEITARHILITPSVTDDMNEEEKAKEKKKAKEKAEKLIKKLEDGAKFEDLVKKNSDDEGSKNDGGLIENITKDSVVDSFYTACTKLKDGEYTKEPVESSYGYHIILRVSQKEKPKLEDVKDDIIDSIVTEKLNKDSTLYTTTFVDIRKKYKLDIKDADIKKGYNAMIR